MEDLHPIIAENLVTLRKDSGLTQAQVAEKLGYSDKAVSRWENGDTLPDINVLNQLCRYYGIELSMLFERGACLDATQVQNKKKTRRYYAVECVLLIAAVWLAATMFYVFFNVRKGANYWTAFVWAVPASALIVCAFDRWFRNRILQFVMASIAEWTLITAIYLQFLSQNIWELFLVGIPLQAFLTMWLLWRWYRR
jgi:transcriptional regulator with XRE-family HTH domain